MSSRRKIGGGPGADGNSVMCKMSQSQWQQNVMVPTYYVAPRVRKGYFSTLNDAITFAEPYSRIEVLSGKYFENVVIQKPIEIGVEKGDEAAEFYSHGVTFTLQDEAYIDGITIRTGDQKTAVLVDNEKPIKPKIIRCELDSIEVSGHANPQVLDNRIRGGRVHGLHVTNHASGTYTDNVIENHAWYGISVETDGQPSFTRNKIQGSEHGQVMVKGWQGGTDGIAPTFSQNRITDELPKTNIKTSVSTRLDDAPVKKAGDRVELIPNSNNAGIAGRAVMKEIEDQQQKEENVEWDPRSAVEVALGATPIITNNTIIGSINNGILYRSGGGGLFEGNFVIANKGWGAVLEDEATNPTFIKNQFSSNGAGGLRVKSSKGVIDGKHKLKNEFKDNRGPQVLVIHGHEDFIFRDNLIQAGSRVGLHCKDGGAGTFTQNEFNYCSSVAVKIETEANPQFTKNDFKMCSISVLCCRAGQGNFANNDFSMNRSACVVVMSHGNPLFESCTFSTSQCAVVVSKGGKGRFFKCQMKDNRGNQIEVSERGNPHFENNTIADGNEDGVKIYDNGRGHFKRNFFCRNSNAHMTVKRRGDPICEENVFTRAVNDGIVIEQKGLGLFTDNIIEKSRGDGIVITTGSFPTVRGNVICQNRHAGLHIGEGGDGVLEKNEIHTSGKANVLVTGSGIPPDAQQETAFALVKRNWIMNSMGYGVLATSHGSAAIVENHFSNNTESAIRAATSSTLFVLGNLIDGGGEGIALVEDARCRCNQNMLLNITGNAIFVDSGAKPFISWNTIDHAQVGICFNSGYGFCFENTIKFCTEAGISCANLNRTHCGFNALYRNHVGIKIGSKCRSTIISNYLVENEAAGILLNGEDVHATLEGNVVLNSDQYGIHCLSGNSKFGSNMVLGCETNICIEGNGSIPEFKNSLIVGGTVGVAAVEQGKGKFESCLIGHCDRGIVLQTKSQPIFKNIIIHNNSIAGVFADKAGSCEIVESTFFKNFINVVGTRDARPYIFRCLLQAPTAFNCYFSNHGGGHVYNCVITSHSTHSNAMLEEVWDSIRRNQESEEEERAAMAVLGGVQPVKGTAAYMALQRADQERHRRSVRTLPPLWDDMFNAQGILGHLTNLMAKSAGLGSTAASAARRASQMPTKSPQDGQDLDASLSNMPGEGSNADEASRRASAVSVGVDSELDFTSDLGLDFSTPATTPLEGHLRSERSSMTGTVPLPPITGGTQPQPATAKYTLKLKPRNRHAVLYPNAMTTRTLEEEASRGPTAGFAHHRQYIPPQQGSGRKGIFEYLCTGVMIDEGANPKIEGCLIKGHSYKAPKKKIKVVRSRQRSIAPDKPLTLQPRAPRTSSMRSAGSSLGRRPQTQDSVNSKYLSSVGQQSLRGTPNSSALMSPASNQPDPDFTHGPFPMKRDTTLHKLLLAASPAFATRSDVYGTNPIDFLEGYWLAEETVRVDPELLLMGKKSPSNQQTQKLTSTSQSPTLLTPVAPAGANTSARPGGPTFTAPADDPSNASSPKEEVPRPTESFTGFAIICANSGEGEITNCIVEHNLNGIKIECGGDPKIHRTVVRKQEGDGVIVSNGGQGTIQACHIHHNLLYQVSVSGEGTHPTIELNDIHDSRHIGVHFDHDAGGLIKRNRVHDMGNVGISVAGNANPTIDCNELFASHLNIGVRKSGRGLFEGNRVFEALSHGILVEGNGAAPTFNNNFISQNAENGVLVTGEGAAPRFVENEIFRNRKMGLENASKASAVIVSNKVYDNYGHGLAASSSATGLFTKNIITGNKGAGFCASSQANPNVICNLVFDGEAEGISVQNATGFYEFNKVKNNAEHGISVEFFKANPTIARNEIEGGMKAGIVFVSEAKGTVTENFIANNNQGGVIVSFGAHPTIERNFLKQNSQSGVWCKQKARPEIIANIIVLTANGHGVVSEDEAVPSIRQNIIGHHSHSGVHFFNSGKGTCSENIIFSCGEANVCIEQLAAPALMNNEIFDGSIGICVRDDGAGTITNTAVYGKLLSGISVRGENSKPTFEGCFIHDIKGIGICDDGKAVFSGCHVYGCQVGLECRGDMTFTESQIRECPNGVVAYEGATATISHSVLTSLNKIGVVTHPESKIKVNQIKMYRCRIGMQLEGGGEVTNSEIYWNYENVIIPGGSVRVEGCNIYDADNRGLVIRDGEPTVINNMVFDNKYASVVVDGGNPLVEDNKIYFEQQDGALMAKPEMKGALSKNTVRNVQSPTWEKSVTDRVLYYNVAAKENDRNTPMFKRLIRASDATTKTVLETALPCLIALDRIIPSEYRRRPLDEEFTFDDPEDGEGSEIIATESNGRTSNMSNDPNARIGSDGLVGSPTKVNAPSAIVQMFGIPPPEVDESAATSPQCRNEPLLRAQDSYKFPVEGSMTLNSSAQSPKSLGATTTSLAQFGVQPSSLGMSQVITDDLTVLSDLVNNAIIQRSRGDSLFVTNKETLCSMAENSRMVEVDAVDQDYDKMKKRNRAVSFMNMPATGRKSRELSRLFSDLEQKLPHLQSRLSSANPLAHGHAAMSPLIGDGWSTPASGSPDRASATPGGKKRAVGFSETPDAPPRVSLDTEEITDVAQQFMNNVERLIEHAQNPSKDREGMERSKSMMRPSMAGKMERSQSNAGALTSKRSTLTSGGKDDGGSLGSSSTSTKKSNASRRISKMKTVGRLSMAGKKGSDKVSAEKSGEFDGSGSMEKRKSIARRKSKA